MEWLKKNLKHPGWIAFAVVLVFELAVQQPWKSIEDGTLQAELTRRPIALLVLLLITIIGAAMYWLLVRLLISKGLELLKPDSTHEGTLSAFKVIAACLGVILALTWIGQGLLATQIDIGLSGEAHALEPDHKSTLVTVSLSVENRGVRQTAVNGGYLTVCAGPCGEAPKHCLNPEDDTEANRKCVPIKTLGFDKADGDTEFGGTSNGPYTLVWGTKESRQAAFRMPVADFYDIRLSLGTGEVGAPGFSTKWRASRIIPMETTFVKKEAIEVIKGKSPEIEAPGGESKSALDLFKKLLGGAEK